MTDSDPEISRLWKSLHLNLDEFSFTQKYRF
jgi:hypothetical protein